MKKLLILAAVSYLLLLLIPLPILLISGPDDAGQPEDNPAVTGITDSSPGTTGTGTADTTGEASRETGDQSQDPAEDVFKLYSTESGAVYEITAQELMLGSTAMEMYPTYHAEALKAQAAAVYSYYSVMRERQRQSPDPSIKGADFADTADGHPIYYNDQKLRERWGDNYDTYHRKLSDAVKAVAGKKLLYNGSPILAIYHAISSGTTESASLVWGGEYPYLVPVSSPGDKLSPNYQSDVTFTAEEMNDKLTTAVSAVKIQGEAKSWLGEEIQTTSSGTVQEVKICGVSVTGKQLREALGLRSSCFTAEWREDKFYFTVYGYGHNVGMSQYGADYMARQGSDWQEILKHYYTGITIS